MSGIRYGCTNDRQKQRGKVTEKEKEKEKA
jgi:hypothetical protein